MRKWAQKLVIHDVWNYRNGECGQEKWTVKTIHELAKELSRRIARKWPQYMVDGRSPDPSLIDIVDWFNGIPTLVEHLESFESLANDENVSDDELQDAIRHTPLVEFNEVMDSFYDWCDANDVWVNK